MTYALTLTAVAKHKPCDDAFNRLSAILPKRKKLDAAQARKLGATYDDIIWIAAAVAMDDDALARRLTEYVNDCAKRVLHICEQADPGDDRPRESIQATDDWLDGKISEDSWKEAAWVARDAWTARVARDAWTAWAEFYKWQFDRLVYWLTEKEPVRLSMPEFQKDVEGISA